MFQQLTVADATTLAKNELIVFGVCPQDATPLDKPILPRYFGDGSVLNLDVVSYSDVTTQPRKTDGKKFFIRNIICTLKQDASVTTKEINSRSGVEYYNPTTLKAGGTLQVTVTGTSEESIKIGIKKIVGTSIALPTTVDTSIAIHFA